jgi:hypothetical protein
VLRLGRIEERAQPDAHCPENLVFAGRRPLDLVGHGDVERLRDPRPKAILLAVLEPDAKYQYTSPQSQRITCQSEGGILFSPNFINRWLRVKARDET